MLKDIKDGLRWVAILIGCIALILGCAALIHFDYWEAAKALLCSAGFGGLFAVCRAAPNSEDDRSDFGLARLLLGSFGLLFFLAGLYAAGDGELVPAAQGLGEALFLGFCCWLAHRYVLGWFIDENGERQKIKGINRGRVFYIPTTWDQRSTEEFEFKRERRLGLIVLALYVAVELDAFDNVRHAAHPNLAAVFLLICGIISAPVAVPMLAVLIGRETAYLFGYQDMKGAKVLDPEPRKAGLDAVAAQKALGDAQLAAPGEARELLSRES